MGWGGFSTPAMAQPSGTGKTVTPGDAESITQNPEGRAGSNELSRSRMKFIAGGSYDIRKEGKAGLTELIVQIVRIALGFLGIIFLSMTLYAGYLWAMAGGNADQVETAKKWLINGFIGLMIIMLSWGITAFVLSSIKQSTIEYEYE